MSRTVLRGARSPGDVAIEHGRIVAVGVVAPEPDDEVVDCERAVITPGRESSTGKGGGAC